VGISGAASEEVAGAAPTPASAGFGARGRMRRRLRFLRKARELAYRDLGGLVYEMQRLGERHDELAAAKLATLAAIDAELRTLEAALDSRQPVTVLREAGIAACPRCAAIHGSEDRFCPACGLPMGHHADRPIATTTTVPAAAPGAPATQFPPVAPLAPGSPAPRFPTPPPPVRPPASTFSKPPATPAPATSAPTAPAAAPPAAPQSAPAPAPASDDRPTEIIRPPNPAPGGGA
jgi:hypothetical protein